MQVDHVPAAGAGVQPVDVLRDQELNEPLGLELRECAMCAVGLRAADDGPADGAARPVPLAHLGVGHERAEIHGPRAFPLALLVPVVGNAGARADAGAGEHREAGMCLDEIAQRVHLPIICG